MMVATYALCGFSNFGAMATLVSTLKVMAPSKTKDINQNAYWALLTANIVCDMTACIAGKCYPYCQILQFNGIFHFFQEL